MMLGEGRARALVAARPGPPAWIFSSGYVLMAVALAAASGALYALVSNRLDDARILPIIAAALVALALGVWRLEYGVALLILATPFAENAPISQPGEAKIRVALILWAVALVAIQAGRTIVTEHRLDPPPMFAGAVVFLAAALVAVMVASDQREAGAKFLLLAGSFVIYLLVGMFLTDWRALRPVLFAFLFVGLAISAHAIYQYVVGDLSRVGFVSVGGAIEYRVASVFPHPNQLAGFLAIFVPLGAGLVGVWRGWPAKSASLALVGLASFAVVLTYSRGALVALAALTLVYARDKRAWPFVAASIALIVVLAPSVWQDRLADTGNLERPEIATRFDVWGAGWTMFEEHPVAGVGLDNFASAYVELEQPGRSFLPGTSFGVPETAHSIYFTTLAEQGLIGAAALLVLILSAGRMILTLRQSPDRRVRAMSQALWGVGIVLLFHNVFDVTFTDSKTSTLVWTLFGIGAALHRVGGANVASARPR
jgi:O-antigen ligase